LEATVPPVADHATEVLLVPVTVAVNCFVPPVDNDADPGVMATATTGVALTVTFADADLVVSAALVAVTV